MIITLTTDFGEAAPYVAAMKGVILSINPKAQILDLSHRIPPQNVRHAAFFLAGSLIYFPRETLHVVVVDPGVGTERAVLYIEVNGQRVLAPDNGCWTWLPGADSAKVIRLSDTRFWRSTVGNTFHGRDIFAPVAAHLSRGVKPADLGPSVKEWTRLDVPALKEAPGCIQGEVVFVDDFGNLITNIPADKIQTRPEQLKVGRRTIRAGFQWVRTYGEAPADALVALISSFGTLEIAVVQGNAARRLKAAAGALVTIENRARTRPNYSASP